MGTNKAIGTKFETEVLKLLKDVGFETCRRVVLHGALDEGDIHIGKVNHPDIVIECKSRKTEVSYKNVEGFLEEAHREYFNSNPNLKNDESDVIFSYVFLKRPNLGVKDGYIIWKSKNDITIRARIGDVICKENFSFCKTEEDRIIRFKNMLS